MSFGGRIIAGFAIAAYLAAAFLPCEPAEISFSAALPAVETHAVTLAATVEPTAHSHHGSHARAVDAPSLHESHDDVLTADDSLVWTPTCLCGCSESRAQIGGGAARLGPAVPADSAARLASKLTIAVAMCHFDLVSVPDSVIDPIPI